MSGESHSADHAALLRRHGLQVTAQRLAVLRSVSERPHSTAESIDKLVRAELGAISRQAVYDALGTLTDKGLLRRIQPGPGGGTSRSISWAEDVVGGSLGCVALVSNRHPAAQASVRRVAKATFGTSDVAKVAFATRPHGAIQTVTRVGR